MGLRVDDVIAKLPKERRKRIAAKADEMAKEMIAYADSLRVVRKALSKTQSKIGEDLGLSQNSISQLEGRTDLLLSTLRRYVRALGADLDLVVRMKDGSKVLLEGLGQAKEHARGVSPKRVKKSARRRVRGGESRSSA
jgi:transcriptional regulator with XRE-family HTH domain